MDWPLRVNIQQLGETQTSLSALLFCYILLQQLRFSEQSHLKVPPYKQVKLAIARSCTFLVVAPILRNGLLEALRKAFYPFAKCMKQNCSGRHKAAVTLISDNVFPTLIDLLL